MKIHTRIQITSAKRCGACGKAVNGDDKDSGLECVQTSMQFCDGACLSKSWRTEGHRTLAKMLRSTIDFSTPYSIDASARVCGQIQHALSSLEKDSKNSKDTLFVLMFHPKIDYAHLVGDLRHVEHVVLIGRSSVPRGVARKLLASIVFDLTTVRSTDAAIAFGDAISFIFASIAPTEMKKVMLGAFGFESAPHRPLLCGMARIASCVANKDRGASAWVPASVPPVTFPSGVKLAEHLVHAASTMGVRDA
jgi:hypothetical protein